MTDIEKYVLEGLCKYTIIEKLNRTTKQNNLDLENYILYKMTFEQSLLLNIDKSYLTEDAMTLSAEREVALGKNIKGTAATLEPILQLGFAIAAGGKIMNIAMQTAGKAGVVTGIAGGILASLGMSWGLQLLSKVVQYAVMKLLSPCSKMCDKKFSYENGVMARGELVAENKLCNAKCKIDAYFRVIAELKRQLRNCENTQNSNRCMSGINAQLAKYQKLIADEQDNYRKKQQKLADVKRKGATT